MKSEKLAQQIREKIKAMESDITTVIADFTIRDMSVQAELRLKSVWTINRNVDKIEYPKDLSGNARELWGQMGNLTWDITKTTKLLERKNDAIFKINEKKKSGPAERAEAKNQFIIASGKQFLADHKKTASKSNIKMIDKKISDLQAQQKALLPALRKSNSEFCAQRKNAKSEQGKKNAAALISGRFWEADETAIKEYFHPPFAKNYLADVSEKWRAALFLECESISYKGYNGDWRHKLGGTGRGYLCGIDDNGDEWGFIVDNLPQSHDDYGNAALNSTVAEAMCNVFDISKKELDKCTRQGDLLFCPATIPTEDKVFCQTCGALKSDHYKSTEKYNDGHEVERDLLSCFYKGAFDQYRERIVKKPVLHSSDQWEPRTAHIITSPSLKHNGVYFCADDEITVIHTSHPAVILPAGEYQLYMSTVADPVD